MLVFTLAALAAQALTVSSKYSKAPNISNAHNFTVFHEDKSPLIVKRLAGGKNCWDLCTHFRNVDYDCIQGGWRTKCEEACIDTCFLYDDESEDPKWTDLVTSVSEEPWGTEGPVLGDRFSTDAEFSADEVAFPCRWCKRDVDGHVIPPNSDFVDSRVQMILARVENYGSAYHHIHGFAHEAPRKKQRGVVGTTLDDYLRHWVVGYKKAAVGSEDRQQWYNDLVDHVMGSVDIQPQYWAYRFELITRKDTDKEVDKLVAGLEAKDKKAIRKAVDGTWRDSFRDCLSSVGTPLC